MKGEREKRERRKIFLKCNALFGTFSMMSLLVFELEISFLVSVTKDLKRSFQIGPTIPHCFLSLSFFFFYKEKRNN